MRKEHFKGVIWSRETPRIKDSTTDVNGKKVYRYAIVGLLITDSPLNLPHVNEFMIDGGTTVMGMALEQGHTRRPNYSPGEAGDVLVSLSTL